MWTKSTREGAYVRFDVKAGNRRGFLAIAIGFALGIILTATLGLIVQ